MVPWCCGVVVLWCCDVVLFCYDVMVLWCCGVLVLCYGVLVLCFYGFVVPWCVGVMVLWCCGVVVLFCYDVMVLWCFGVMVLWFYGVVVLWCYGVLVLCFYGFVVPWCCGVMVFRVGRRYDRLWILELTDGGWRQDCGVTVRLEWQCGLFAAVTGLCVILTVAGEGEQAVVLGWELHFGEGPALVVGLKHRQLDRNNKAAVSCVSECKTLVVDRLLLICCLVFCCLCC